ncbi:hypothetical protein GH714_019490 [Hevea brasiliensis]|uniref:Uncharacterized protein n=1 Tax=Hevea brasiliensis TaxID=3981 RepID=A0A6A6M6A2_HEVBR|nr:hypothetical protein GH714_019490 [Hevea brasiliensis]
MPLSDSKSEMPTSTPSPDISVFVHVSKHSSASALSVPWLFDFGPLVLGVREREMLRVGKVEDHLRLEWRDDPIAATIRVAVPLKVIKEACIIWYQSLGSPNQLPQAGVFLIFFTLSLHIEDLGKEEEEDIGEVDGLGDL